MRRFIHKLRQKPKSTRQKIAFGTSASVTGVIFAVWLTVMIAGGGVSTTTGNETTQSQAASPLAAFEDNANSAFTEVRDRLTASSTNDATTTATSSEDSNDVQSEEDRTQTIERQPYWEANNEPKEQEQEEGGGSDVQDEDNFWNEDN